MARNVSVRTHDEIFGDIVKGLGEAISFAKGELDPSTYRVHVPEAVDVKAVRVKTGLSQDAFAGAYGLPAGTVRDWEQKRRAPDQAARMYLLAIERDAAGVLAIISDGKTGKLGKVRVASSQSAAVEAARALTMPPARGRPRSSRARTQPGRP